MEDTEGKIINDNIERIAAALERINIVLMRIEAKLGDDEKFGNKDIVRAIKEISGSL